MVKQQLLYSVLKHINKPGMNILTAEDPVEYEMEGIGQVQIKENRLVILLKKL